ncbi:MAG TPA: Na+/H+ antiporter [Xanthobacteraceae bacterium]|nr:Na+/H+ antiporter [Xanthobacteraceae bacterium]
MAETIQTILFLLAVMVVVAVVARRLNSAPGILLVVAGIALALVPGLPRLQLAPELVLLGILPPLIYSAGVAMSWREFRFNLRPIALLAFGCILVTACAVALAMHWLLGMPLAVGFALGAIVSPPDAVAPLALVRRIGLPRRLSVILEGEGLANDATALILYRFAVAAVATGVFSFRDAAGEFAVIVVGEIAYGIGVGWFSLRLRRWAHDPRVEITLSLLTPYAAFLIPQQLGGSGVLATVAAGLYVSWNGPLLIPAATRLQGIFFWDLVVYLLEGFVFLVTGMQTRTILDSMHGAVLNQLLIAIVATVAVIVGVRFAWIFPAAWVPRWINPALRRRDPLPSWRWLFLLAFVGVRGVVSLAAALAIPLTVASGAAFPDRDIILFVTFGVIVVTLIGQGLSLPAVVRSLKLDRDAAKEERGEMQAEAAVRAGALDVAYARLKQFAAEGRASSAAQSLLRARHDYRAGRLARHAPHDDNEGTASAYALRLELIAAEREYIYRQLQEGKITDESRRRIERELDLEEASAACKAEGGQEPPL